LSSILSVPLASTPPAVDMSTAADAGAGGAPTQQFEAPQLGLSNLTRNPQLPQHPLGAYTDSMYEAQVAQLRNDIMTKYNDLLQQLGYTDQNGNFVPGQVEIDANRQRSDLGRNINLADEDTTHQMQQQGTLFSGLRGTAQARAEFPFQSSLAELGVQVPRQLSDLYGQAGGLINDFNTQHNLLLAQAAQRASANLANNAAAGGVNISGAAGGTTPAPPPVDPNQPIPLPTYQAPSGLQTSVSGGQPILEHGAGTTAPSPYPYSTLPVSALPPDALRPQ
jgi:hypothetical protein